MIRKALSGALLVTCCVSCSFMGHKGKKAAPAAADAATAMNSTQIQEKAARASGRKDIVVLPIPDSHGAGADAVTRGLGAVMGEASLPKSVRKGLKDLHDQGRTVFVGGSSASKSEWALREALVHSPPRSLQGMVIYTNATLTDDLKAAGRTAGVSVLKLDV